MVRPPGRHFPGVLVQGDPLHVLRGEVGEILGVRAGRPGRGQRHGQPPPERPRRAPGRLRGGAHGHGLRRPY
ncbi:DUF6959 family protein [Streptomyces sp. NPDC091972]|uniref:DUF6959 family protein n=1 Tax=Streptomyces sp. NPDC091972 TaxID=3366007 RepID=UPI00382ADB20